MRLSEPDQFERELRAMRPEIDTDFGTKLDEWAAAGFPSAAQMKPGSEPATERRRIRLGDRLRGFRSRPLTPAIAALAAVVLAFVVAVGVYQSQQDSLELYSGSDDSGATLEVPDRGLNSAPPSSAAESGGSIEPDPTTVPPVPPREGQLKPGQEREVERTASMELSTEPDEVDNVADGVVEVTERYDGIVASSNVNAGAERGRANFDLRIPAQNLQATLADLSDLASVSERNEGTLDVTAPFISAEERFADAKAEVDALIEELGEADSADEIAQVREQLRVARGELSAARSELAGLKQRTDFSRLAVTVVGDGDADGWSFGDAVDDAGSVLEDLAGATLVALAVIVPLGLIGAALWFGLGAARRRAREQALDD